MDVGETKLSDIPTIMGTSLLTGTAVEFLRKNDFYGWVSEITGTTSNQAMLLVVTAIVIFLGWTRY